MPKALLASLLLGSGLLLGSLASLFGPKPPEEPGLQWLSSPRQLPEFHLSSSDGELNHQSLLGHWSIIAFGFTHCPDVCPNSLKLLTQLAELLKEENLDHDVAFFFVSVDPNRDAPADVHRYAQFFHGALRGATGSREQLRQLASGLGVQLEVRTSESAKPPSHSTVFSLIGPQGALRGRFRPGGDVAAIFDTMRSQMQPLSPRSGTPSAPRKATP